MLHHSQLSSREQIYTHLNADGSGELNFAVDRLRRDPKLHALRLTATPLLPSYARHILDHHGVEDHRILRLIRRGVPFEPIIFCEIDGFHVPVDGNHRYVAAYYLHIPIVVCTIVPKHIWSHYLISGLPSTTAAELRAAFSGIF